jgi:hypothetical protein
LSTLARLRVLFRNVVSARGYQTGPLAATEALERFKADIAAAPRGVAYIVHLLLPHHDYLYGADCTLADPLRWPREKWGSDDHYTSAERGSLYKRYLDQLVCAEKRMADLFAHLKTIDVYDEATIVVHGDHGSRIGEQTYLAESAEMLTEQDLLDHYATHLAIKTPGRAPGLVEEPVALQRVFAETFLDGSASSGPGPADIFVREGGRRGFVSLPFPASGGKGGAPEDRDGRVASRSQGLRGPVN